MPEVVLFPITRSMPWRVVEATALRIAGGANSSISRAVDHLAIAYQNVPPDLLKPVLADARDHIAGRIEQLRAAVGTAPIERRRKPADVIAISDRSPLPAA